MNHRNTRNQNERTVSECVCVDGKKIDCVWRWLRATQIQSPILTNTVLMEQRNYVQLSIEKHILCSAAVLQWTRLSLSIYCGISGDGSGDWWRLNTHTRYIFGMRRDSESSTKAIDIEVARWLIPCYLIYRKMSYIFDCVNTSVRHVLCAVTHLSHCLHDTYHT